MAFKLGKSEKEKLKLNFERCNRNSSADVFYKTVYDDGGPVRYPCYNSLTSGGVGDKPLVVGTKAIVSSKVAAYNYYKWLFYSSQYGELFPEKNLTLAMNNFIIVEPGEKYHTLSALFAIRYPHEDKGNRPQVHPDIVNSWWYFVRNGATEAEAFLLAHVFNVDKECFKVAVTNNHSCFGKYNISGEFAKNFINSVKIRSGSVNRLWGRSNSFVELDAKLSCGCSKRNYTKTVFGRDYTNSFAIKSKDNCGKIINNFRSYYGG